MKLHLEKISYFSAGFLVSCFVTWLSSPMMFHSDKNTTRNVEADIRTLTNTMDSRPTTPNRQPQRKILLDCGGNVASTVKMFRETYPGGKDFIIHSFEIDDRLCPYFSPYHNNHHLHCPVGVSDHDGNMTAFCDATWTPTKSNKMQWGGGSMFVRKSERANNITGGRRLYSYRKTIPTINLSRWIKENLRKEDYVIFKIDIQGGEFCVLDQMLKDGTFTWIDKYYGEYHLSHHVGYSKHEKKRIVNDVRNNIDMVLWEGEFRNYVDFDKLHPIQIPALAVGKAGSTYKKCVKNNDLAIVITIGMCKKEAVKVMSTLASYKQKIPVTVFVYSEFAVQWPELVTSWAKVDDIGLRGTHQYPPGHFDRLQKAWVREAIVTAEMRLNEIGITPTYFLPDEFKEKSALHTQLSTRAFRIVQPASQFPLKNAGLTVDNYDKLPDFTRAAKALEFIHEQLETEHGGILRLDTDLPDTHMIIVFLLDYLLVNSEYNIITLDKCIV
ncbi:uncharacterized protein [Antedon mediterranea]|uniref:uncharacterized protein n=1 Tax=Antedon mediterranea TaxID=105859 RepID=UPI003AF8EB4F